MRRGGRGPSGGNAVVTPLATRGRLMDLQSANYISDRPYGERNKRRRDREGEREREKNNMKERKMGKDNEKKREREPE